MCEMKQEGQFSKNNNLLQYAIQLVCVLKWNKRGHAIQLVSYWNETRTVFKKNPIYYSMLFNKRGSFQKTTIYYCMLFNLCAYWNETRGTVFKKKTIYYSMLFNLCAYWNETRGAVFKKKKKHKRGSFQKTTIYYSMLFNLCAYWNETRWTVFKKIQLMTICY